MIHSLLLLTVGLIPGLAPSVATTAPSSSLAIGTAASPLQELPIRYAGDGLTILVNSFDERTMIAKGTIQIGADAPLPFRLELKDRSNGTQTGKGTVTDGKFDRRISTREALDGTVKVTYRAKRYEVAVQSGEAVPEEPGPGKGASTAAPSPSATPKGTIRLRQHTFKDSKLGGMASHTILVPNGWDVEGGALWFPEAYFKLMPTQEIKVVSPEGVSVTIEGEFSATDYIPPPELGMQRPKEGTADAGLPILYLPEDLESWKRLVQEKVLPEAHPKAKKLRVADAQIVPDLTKMLHRELQPQMARVAQDNQVNQQMGMTSFVDGWVLAFECYFTEGGQEFEEFRLVVITAMGSAGSFTGKQTIWTQGRGFTLTAPKGRLEAETALLMAVMGSLKATEPWERNRAKLMAKINNISHKVAMNNLRESAKRSKIMSDAQSEANRTSMEGYRSRNASSSRVQEGTINAIRETEFYSVPGSNTRVELPSGYSHVYSNGAGEYLLTNDALLDPSTDLGEGTWSAMTIGKR